MQVWNGGVYQSRSITYIQTKGGGSGRQKSYSLDSSPQWLDKSMKVAQICGTLSGWEIEESRSGMQKKQCCRMEGRAREDLVRRCVLLCV
jgi:hypothetical protein